MAVLQNMREKFGIAISVIIALSLLYFIAPMDDLMTLFGKPQNVGEIAGKGVSYEDYLAEVDKQTRINEIMTGSSVQNEQAQEQIRNAAWQEFIDRDLFLKNAKAAGIRIGKAEMVELTSGENPSPVIAQSGIFNGEDGAFSRQAVVDFVQNIPSDETGNMKTIWNYLQNVAYTQQFYAKYGSLFTAGNYANALQKESEIAMNNAKANVDYVLAPYSYAVDTTVVISDAAINAYYKAHKNEYRQVANRDIEYVVYEVVPSVSDIALANEKMNEAYAEFPSVEDSKLKSFMLKNSERQLLDYWYKAGELNTVNSEIGKFVDENNPGAVSPVIVEGNSFYAVKVLDKALRSEEITVRLIPAMGATELADSVITQLRMAEPMRMTQSYMVAGCESLMDAKVGVPQLVKSKQYGMLAAEVVTKSEPVEMKKVAILEKTAIASKETFNNFYSQANTFATIAGGSFEGYKAAIDSLGTYSHQMNVTEATASYGPIDQAKEVTRWVFDSKKGKASGIITVNQKYFFVVGVKDVHKEGFKTASEVAPMIRQTLYTRERNANRKAEVAAKIAGLNSLEEIAEALGTTVSAGEEISFATMGRGAVEPAALGAMFKAPEGVISGPVAGMVGVYVFKVNSREAGEFYTAEDVDQMQAQKSQYSSRMIMPVMMEAANVKDNRARYF